MNRIFRLCAPAAVFILTTTAPTLADVTAKEAWDDWLNQIQDAGYQVQYDADTSGGILSINNLTLSRDLGGANALTAVELPPIGYRERGDGTVDVLIPEDARVVFTFNNELHFTFNQHLSGLSYIISGSPKALAHTLIASKISYNLTDVNGSTADKETKIDITFGAVAISTATNSAELQSLSTDASIGEISYDIHLDDTDATGGASTFLGSLTDLHFNADLAIPADMQDAELDEIIDAGFAVNGGIRYGSLKGTATHLDNDEDVTITYSADSASTTFKAIPNADSGLDVAQNLSLGAFSIDVNGVEDGVVINVTAKMSDLGANYELTLPGNFDPDQMPAALNNGFSFDAAMKHGPISGQFSAKTPEQATNNAAGTLIAESANMFLSLDRQTMRYGGNSGSIKLSAETTELPVGLIEYSLASSAFDMLMPVNVSSTPEDFILQYSFVDFWANEALWSLADPTAKLPHDPATVVFDIAGAGNWLVDIMDNGLDQDNGGAPKGEIHSLTVNTLQVNAAGVELIGSGDFTFDNNDLTSYDGVPAPTGTLDLKLTGGNGLIDSLIAMGLLPEDQAMAVRMGLGLFTIAGDGDDTLVSHIEATGDGKVLANGQRLK